MSKVGTKFWQKIGRRDYFKFWKKFWIRLHANLVNILTQAFPSGIPSLAIFFIKMSECGNFWPNEHFAWFGKFVVENEIEIWFWWSRKWRTGARRRNMFHIGDILIYIQVHEKSFEVSSSRFSLKFWTFFKVCNSHFWLTQNWNLYSPPEWTKSVGDIVGMLVLDAYV